MSGHIWNTRLASLLVKRVWILTLTCDRMNTVWNQQEKLLDVKKQPWKMRLYSTDLETLNWLASLLVNRIWIPNLIAWWSHKKISGGQVYSVIERRLYFQLKSTRLMLCLAHHLHNFGSCFDHKTTRYRVTLPIVHPQRFTRDIVQLADFLCTGRKSTRLVYIRSKLKPRDVQNTLWF